MSLAILAGLFTFNELLLSAIFYTNSKKGTPSLQVVAELIRTFFECPTDYVFKNVRIGMINV